MWKVLFQSIKGLPHFTLKAAAWMANRFKHPNTHTQTPKNMSFNECTHTHKCTSELKMRQKMSALPWQMSAVSASGLLLVKKENVHCSLSRDSKLENVNEASTEEEEEKKRCRCRWLIQPSKQAKRKRRCQWQKKKKRWIVWRNDCDR